MRMKAPDDRGSPIVGDSRAGCRCFPAAPTRLLSSRGAIQGIRARLTPEQGERVVRAVEAAMDEAQDELKDVSAETSSH
jgi:hypothetical protein